jgi:hypothetical protein
MTVQALARRAQPHIAGHYRRVRSAHPVHVLRWLRNGVLLSVAAATLLYLWVAIQAGSDIAAARRTLQAVAEIKNAGSAVRDAGNALDKAFSYKDVTLLGTGPGFVNRITQVNKLLTLAAEGNAAGAEGTAEIQYVQNQLASYLQLSETAVQDYALGGPLGKAELQYAMGAEGDVQSAITDLTTAEQTALDAQRRAWTLDPGTFWWALLGPVTGMLLLIAATANLVARHFRRHVSRSLWGSLLITAAVMVTAGLFDSADARSLSADPWAGYPASMAVALLLLLAAAVLAQLAYRARLAEYRFQP